MEQLSALIVFKPLHIKLGVGKTVQNSAVTCLAFKFKAVYDLALLTVSSLLLLRRAWISHLINLGFSFLVY